MSLSVARPRVRERRLDPAIAAGGSVLILVLTGVVRVEDVLGVGVDLWRPAITIVSIMVSTAVAHRLGVLEQLGRMIFADPETSARQIFLRVFVFTAVTSTLLNNDAAILLLTPLVLTLVQHRFPGQRRLSVAFAFAVFTAIGVAPLVISNPMNMVVADYADLDFNDYALRMFPITLVGWVITFCILRWIFDGTLGRAPEAVPVRAATGLDSAQKAMLALLAGAIGVYPLVAIVDDGLIWAVAAAGAVAAVMLAWTQRPKSPMEILRHDVAWNVLAFLGAIFVLAIGLRNVGLVDALADVYAEASIFEIGATAAAGSAVLNNHPMAIINVMALETSDGVRLEPVLAALVGGDLGPRLLPIGSLAGLLWIEACRRHGVKIRVGDFIRVGVTVTLPALAASLLLLRLS